MPQAKRALSLSISLLFLLSSLSFAWADVPPTPAKVNKKATKADTKATKTDAKAAKGTAKGTKAVAKAAASGLQKGELIYTYLQENAKKKGQAGLFKALHTASAGITWDKATATQFIGNLRPLRLTSGDKRFYLVRELDGKVHIVALPKDANAIKKGSKSPYADLAGKVRHKMAFVGQLATSKVNGKTYTFFKFTKAPKRQLLDRLFFIGIVLLLFLTMVGMGITLTTEDFARIAKNPRGMIVGPLCQFGLLPLIALGLGMAMGFYKQYPYIFVGLLLVSTSPGGVTSNLMTYLGRGDVALSVSLTALSTILSLALTPLLLTLYAANVPNVSIPVGDVIKQIMILVIIPLFVGMLLRAKAEGFAKRAEKTFAAIGVFSLLFLIAVGVLGNLDKFADTTRYGAKFYATIFLLTLSGMLLGGLLSKLLRVPNSQVRAISLETGLQNASLAMTIALLLQDRMGDFYSSMFFTSGIFGLWMYAAGAFTILIFPKWLPLESNPTPHTQTT